MGNLIKHTYHCYRAGCKEPDLWSYSEKGLDIHIRFHEMKHQNESIANMQKFDAVLKSKPRPNYNVLKITVIDIGFLKTRGIKVDDDMELVADGRYGSKISEEKSENEDAQPFHSLD